MKKILSSLLTLAGIAALAAPLTAHGPSYRAKVYTTGGHVWTLHDLQDRSGIGEWRYWAPGEAGVLSWGEVASVTFLENLQPYNYTTQNREIPHGQRAEVVYQNGEVRELYLAVEVLTGVDDWGGRRTLSENVTRVEFLETDHPTVLRCPNGHVWDSHREYRYCPYDSQPLTPYQEY